MIYSGADLIRTSGQQAERVERLTKHAEPIAAVQPPQKNESGLNDGLLRFARFIHKEKQKKPGKTPPKGIPEGYRAQISSGASNGGMIDIYI